MDSPDEVSVDLEAAEYAELPPDVDYAVLNDTFMFTDDDNCKAVRWMAWKHPLAIASRFVGIKPLKEIYTYSCGDVVILDERDVIETLEFMQRVPPINYEEN